MKSFLFLLFIFTFSFISCFEKEMTVNVEPRREDCFFQSVTKGEVIDFAYQVIDGGNLDITFQLSEPNGRILFMDYKKPENNHRTEALQTGDYKFCLDNTFSTYNSKTVFFELSVERDGDDWDSNEEWDNDIIKSFRAEDILDIKVQDIQDIINRVHGHLSQAKHYQMSYKNFEARDRNTAEDNYSRVNLFSLIQVVLMISVGILQVIVVKGGFDDSSRVNKTIKKLNTYMKR